MSPLPWRWFAILSTVAIAWLMLSPRTGQTAALTLAADDWIVATPESQRMSRAGLDAAYRRWLADDNFDARGEQKVRLSDLTAPFVHARSM